MASRYAKSDAFSSPSNYSNKNDLVELEKKKTNPKENMSLEALESFCKATKHSEMFHFGPKCNSKDPGHIARVTEIIEHEWDTNEVAICNLLQHPLLIPRELVAATLSRGLKGASGHPFYRVAAAAGYQRVPKAWLTSSEWDTAGPALICTACEPPSADAPWPLSIAAFQAALRSELVRNTLPLLLTPLWCNSEAAEDVATFVFVCSWKEHIEQTFREMIEKAIPEKNDAIQGMINVLVKQFKTFKEAKQAGYTVHEGPSTTHIPDYFEYQLQKKYNNCSPSLVASLIVTFDALDGNDDGFITGKEYNDFISRDSEREAGDGTQRMKITNSVRVQELLPEDAKIGIDEFFEKRITALLDAQGKQNTCFKPMTCTLKE